MKTIKKHSKVAAELKNQPPVIRPAVGDINWEQPSDQHIEIKITEDLPEISSLTLEDITSQTQTSSDPTFVQPGEDVVDREQETVTNTTTRTVTTIITSSDSDNPGQTETTVIVNEMKEVNGDAEYESETITAVPNRFNSESDSDATSLQIQETLQTIVDEQQRQLEAEGQQQDSENLVDKTKSRTIESSSGSDVALHEPGVELSDDETGLFYFKYFSIFYYYLCNFLSMVCYSCILVFC